MARPDDSLQVRAEVQGGEVGRLAALADDDQISTPLEVQDGLDDVAVAQLGLDVDRTRALQPLPRRVQDRPAALQAELGLLPVEFGQLFEECAAGAKADAAAQVRRFARHVAPAQHVQDLDRGVGAAGDPGGAVADALGVDRSVDERDQFRHGSSPLLVPHEALQGAGLVVDRQPVDDRLAGIVQADDLDLGPLAAELQDGRVERRDA